MGIEWIDIARKYDACSECCKEAGGVWPEGHLCTASLGKCSICGKDEVYLIPWVDFDWPDEEEHIDCVAKLHRD